MRARCRRATAEPRTGSPGEMVGGSLLASRGELVGVVVPAMVIGRDRRRLTPWALSSPQSADALATRGSSRNLSTWASMLALMRWRLSPR